MGMGMEKPDVLIIGAGVVGLSTALALMARGKTVRVIDREGPAAGASQGNAGAFAFTDVLPLASPRIIRQAPKWLLDPLGPLSIPPSYALTLLPWLYRFWRASFPAQVAASTVTQTAMMGLSKAALEAHLAREGLTSMLRHEGNLQVYEGEAEFRSSLPGWALRAELGIAFEHVTGEEIARFQPGLSRQFTHATFTPGWYSISDPKDYTLALADRVREKGGEIILTEARAVTGAGVETASGLMQAGHVIVAAGAFSHRLLKPLGLSVPLETERGYNTTLPGDAFDIRTQITFGGHGFVVTRLSSGIRVGGAVELGGLELPPNYRRSEAMLTKAARFLPGLKTEGGRQWMGFRPSLPDSLPAIGRVPGHEKVLCAFGHGHLGLTQSAGTAEIIADLATGKTPGIDIAPFAPNRF